MRISQLTIGIVAIVLLSRSGFSQNLQSSENVIGHLFRLQQEGRLSEAVSVLKQVPRSKIDARLLSLYMVDLCELGDADGAIRISASNPKLSHDPQVLRALAACELDAGRPLDSSRDLARLPDSAIHDPELLDLIIRSSLDSAAKLLEEARQLPDGERYVEVLRAASQRPNGARELFPEVLAKLPFLSSVGNPADAQPVIAKSPADPRVLYYFAVLFGEQALSNMQDLVDDFPESSAAKRLLAAAYLHAEQPDEAAKLYAELTNNGSSLEGLYEAGMFFRSKRLWAESRKAFLRLTQLSPEDERPIAGLADVDMHLNQLDEAQKLLETLEKKHPVVVNELILARIASRKDDDTVSIAWLNQSIKRDPKNLESHYRLSRELLKVGKSQEAALEMKVFLRLKQSSNNMP